jgi:hypothetical protein
LCFLKNRKAHFCLAAVVGGLGGLGVHNSQAVSVFTVFTVI